MDVPAVIAHAVVAPAPTNSVASGRAMAIIRVVNMGAANEKGWNQGRGGARREVILTDQNGRPMLLRIIDYP